MRQTGLSTRFLITLIAVVAVLITGIAVIATIANGYRDRDHHLA